MWSGIWWWLTVPIQQQEIFEINYSNKTIPTYTTRKNQTRRVLQFCNWTRFVFTKKSFNRILIWNIQRYIQHQNCTRKRIVQCEIICIDLCVGVSVDSVLQLCYRSRESKNCKENALLLGNNFRIIFVNHYAQASDKHCLYLVWLALCFLLFVSLHLWMYNMQIRPNQQVVKAHHVSKVCHQ